MNSSVEPASRRSSTNCRKSLPMVAAAGLFRGGQVGKLNFMQPPLQLSAAELSMLERGEPVRLLVNDAQEAVLVLAEQYERLKQCIEFADTDPKELYPL